MNPFGPSKLTFFSDGHSEKRIFNTYLHRNSCMILNKDARKILNTEKYAENLRYLSATSG